MDAKNLLKKLDYLPRWAWYLISLSVGGPVGPLAVYLGFHVLEKVADEQEEQRRQEKKKHRTGNAAHASSTYQDDECFVTSDEEVLREWQRTEQSAARAQAQQAAQQAKKEETIIEENADVAAVIKSGRDALLRIRKANDIIADEMLSSHIDSIENSCRQILTILEQRPQLLTELRTFLRYYLPTTLRLLDARAKLENTASTPKAREVRTRISEALGVIDKAFLKQVEALDAYRFIDLESEMDVLRDMLKADGFIEEEKEEDPFAAVLGGH